MPKGSSHANAALGTALLFTARLADANHDRLRFTYGLSFEKWSAYYNFTNEHLQIVWLPEEEMKKTLGALLTDASKKLDEEYPALRKEIVRYVGTQNYKLSHE